MGDFSGVVGYGGFGISVAWDNLGLDFGEDLISVENFCNDSTAELLRPSPGVVLGVDSAGFVVLASAVEGRDVDEDPLPAQLRIVSFVDPATALA
jgi:hypothetical protein